jgi:hypothetical protein
MLIESTSNPRSAHDRLAAVIATYATNIQAPPPTPQSQRCAGGV